MNLAMIRTEFYKIVCKKYLWIFAIFFSIIFALFSFQFKDKASVQYSLQPIHDELHQAVDNKDLGNRIRTAGYESSYDVIKPFLAASAVDYIEQYRNVSCHGTSVASLLENEVAYKICNYYERLDNRQNEIQTLQDSLAEMQKNGTSSSFLYKAQTKLLSMYGNDGKIELNLESWDKISDINYAWMVPACTMLIILLGLAGVYSDEYINKTQSALLTAKKGRQGVFLSKLIAGTLFSFLCVIYFQLFTLLITKIVYGFPSVNISLMSLYGFKLTPFSWSAPKFYLIQVLGSLFAAFTMGALIMCLSVYCKNALLPFFLAGAYYGGTFIWVKTIILPQYVTTLLSLPAELSPFMLQSITDLVSAGRFINLFGNAVPTIYANIIFNLLIALVSLLLCYRGYVRKQVKD